MFSLSFLTFLVVKGFKHSDDLRAGVNSASPNLVPLDVMDNNYSTSTRQHG